MVVEFDAKKYWNERLTKQYDLMGVGDISLTLNYNLWSYKVTRRILKKVIKKYVGSKPGKVLDIGSGTGFVIEIWQHFNKHIVGIDISNTAIANLKCKFPIHEFFELDVGDNMPFTNNSFQAVTAASVMYHIMDDIVLHKLLESLSQNMEPDGIFIFSDNFTHKNNINIIHQKVRTLEKYEVILKQHGFEIIERVPNYVLFNDPVDAKSKFYPRVWSILTRLSKNWKWFDAIIWPLLYPLELLLTSIKKESPAQEFMICRLVK